RCPHQNSGGECFPSRRTRPIITARRRESGVYRVAPWSRFNVKICLCVLWALVLAGAALAPDDRPVVFPKFRVQEIDTGLGAGYAVVIVDLNNDGKTDIAVVDQRRVLWYENPTWRRRVILEGQTKPDNVCIAAHDIDGDGRLDLVLGADWKPFNTKDGGTLQW